MRKISSVWPPFCIHALASAVRLLRLRFVSVKGIFRLRGEIIDIFSLSIFHDYSTSWNGETSGQILITNLRGQNKALSRQSQSSVFKYFWAQNVIFVIGFIHGQVSVEFYV